MSIQCSNKAMKHPENLRPAKKTDTDTNSFFCLPAVQLLKLGQESSQFQMQRRHDAIEASERSKIRQRQEMPKIVLDDSETEE